MPIQILEKVVNIDFVKELAKTWYVSMIKGTVDLVNKKVALGGDYHLESSELLVKAGGKHSDIWGFNIRFENNPNGELEFDSLVNIKPNFGNQSRQINDEQIIKQATEIIKNWIKFESNV